VGEYSQTAAYYDLLYQKQKDYAAEATQIATLIRGVRPEAQTLLDVACGTGEHARALAAQGFEVDGTDIQPAFLDIARRKHPDGTFFEADMRSLEASSRYDAVVCLFSSIGYVRTVEHLNQTLRAFARCLRPGGVVIVEPWFEPGTMTHGFTTMHTASTDDVKICRMTRTLLHEKQSILEFEYLVTRATGIERFSERHELGLFTRHEMETAFQQASLSVTYDPEGLTGRGLYIGYR